MSRSHTDLVYGNEEYNIHGTSKRYEPQEALTWENACLYSPEGTDMRRSCESFERGLMKTGMHAALEEYVFTVRKVSNFISHVRKIMREKGSVEVVVDAAAQQFEEQKRYPYAVSVINASDWTVLKRQMLHIPDFLMLYHMAQHPGYLHLALMESAGLLEREAIELMDDFIEVVNLMWILFLIMLLATYLFLMRRYLHKLNRSAQQSRTMLLVLPGEVLMLVESTRTFIKKCEEEAILVN